MPRFVQGVNVRKISAFCSTMARLILTMELFFVLPTLIVIASVMASNLRRAHPLSNARPEFVITYFCMLFSNNKIIR